jgi:Protein of unknown function (DUF3261)
MTPRPDHIAISVVLALAGCTNLSGTLFQLDEKAPAPPAQAAPTSQAPLIAPGAAIVLPKPREMGRSLEVVQLVTLRFAGQSLSFDARLSITPDRLVLVGIDGMGRRAMTVVWNGETMTVETAPWLPSAVRPSSILSDVVVLFFPIGAVRQALAAAGCELAITKRTRVVHCGEADVIQAEYDERSSALWNGKLQYRNLAWGYEVEVSSAELKR